MKIITIYGKPGCGFCEAAKGLCTQIGADYEYIDVTTSDELLERHKARQDQYQHYTVPLILADGEFIGGFSELQQAYQAGELSLEK